MDSYWSVVFDSIEFTPSFIARIMIAASVASLSATAVSTLDMGQGPKLAHKATFYISANQQHFYFEIVSVVFYPDQ